jgi:PAS domain-containing protein
MLVIVTLGAAISLVLLGVMLSRRMLRESEAFENALQLSEERFALAMVGSNDGLWDWNVITGEMYLSPRSKELAGYADNEIENTPAAFLALLHPDDRAGAVEALRAHLRDDAHTTWNSVAWPKAVICAGFALAVVRCATRGAGRCACPVR